MRRLFAALGAAALWLASSNAVAATITVTNTNDSGPGSLRNALASASPGDAINFSLTLPATIDLTSGELLITQDVTITGLGADHLTIRRSTADGIGQFRIFEMVGGPRVVLSGMTISNGWSGSGGAISTSGDLTIDNAVLTGNTSDGSSAQSNYPGGGAITVSGGSLTITNSTIDSNTCGDGSTLCLGGGINVSPYTPATLRISGSTISNNSASYAGGLFLGSYGIDADIRNTTISGNHLTNGNFGNALIVYALTGTHTAKFTAVTIAGPAPSLVSLMNVGSVPRVEFRDTILSSPAPTYTNNGGGLPDIVSNGFNIATDTPGFLTAVGDLNNTDPLLAPLANYGGPTATHRLESGSPAIDAGNCADSANAAILVDQRGISRPQGPACDIGAFEAQVGGLENLDVAVSTRASQASVNNLQNFIAQGLDTTVSSRASQGSVDNVQAGVNNLQNAVGSRASQVSVDAITGVINGKLDAAISTRATQTSVDTVQNNLGSVQSGIGTVQSDLGTVQNGLGTVQNNLGSVQTGLGVVQTNLSTLATQASVNQLSTSIGNLFTGLGTISTQVSGVGTQVTGLSTALDAPVSTRASQASLDALANHIGGGMPLRPFIELQLLVGARLSSLYLPAAFGGNLETVRDLVASTIAANKQAGIDVKTAPDLLAAGNAAFAAGNYRLAYDTYSRAYQVCALGR